MMKNWYFLGAECFFVLAEDMLRGLGSASGS